MGLKYLSNVHTGRNTEWVENDVNRCSILKEWHVLNRSNLGDNTLVSVATGHLVADGELTLCGDVNLNLLVNAGRKVVSHFKGSLLLFIDVLNEGNLIYRF